MWALYICIFIVIYGRMIEIYLVTSVAPVPMAAMMGKEDVYKRQPEKELLPSPLLHLPDCDPYFLLLDTR